MLHIIENNKKERAILIGLVTQNQTLEQLNEYFDELVFLAETAGAETIEKFYQKLPHPDMKTYVGKGKLQEIVDFVTANEIDLVILDDEISPSQLRNIEAEVKIKVVDRSMLILDIFATRAQTVQAKTQVELAQTQYMLPRLKGLWSHLDRIKGGIGMRGSGEKEIETDRRVAQQKIALLKEKLLKIGLQNETQRKNRGDLIRVALVGYTNVGKSTIMNLLSKSEVFAENKLFATLDTTVRKIVLDRTPFLLSDTVGFIRKLPHHLIESFKSTLDEVRESDILLHVVDISHPAFEDQIKVVNETLKELNASEKPSILIFNKMDLYEKNNFDKYLQSDIKLDILNDLKKSWMSKSNYHCVFISATEKNNVGELRVLLTDLVKEQYQIRYPYKTEFF
ncbi:MAG: GTPase HflX [Bacteroidetes bacterium]|jgi:GTP-binding protein HflX|nr:GTPase HflX [Bacteroidota bacterium]